MTLGQLATIRTGYLARRAVVPDANGSHHLVQIGDFDSAKTLLNATALLRFTPEASISVKPLCAGEVLFMAKGQRPFAYAIEALPEPSLAAANFFVLRPESNLNADYLAWYLNRESVIRSLTAQAGSGVYLPVIRRTMLENLVIPLPPLKTQLALVELDRLARQEESLLADLGRKRREMLDFYNRQILRPFEETGAQP
ncbi:MAG: restriction endonuclease subunit S [Kiritimatiellia bacterium]